MSSCFSLTISLYRRVQLQVWPYRQVNPYEAQLEWKVRDGVYDGLGCLNSRLCRKSGNLESWYDYNARSQLTAVDGSFFNQKLYYNVSYGGSTGNVSAMSWKAAGDTGMHGYRFSYGGMSRLTAASYLWNGTPRPTIAPPTRITGRVTSLHSVVTDAQVLPPTA